MTLLQYYDEVEKKLTLLINKTIMTYDITVAASMNEKYRADALRVFISGTKKSLSDVLFSARPTDLPSPSFSTRSRGQSRAIYVCKYFFP